MKIKRLAVAAALLSALGGTAYAQDKGFYMGAGGGSTKARQPADCESPAAGYVVSSCDVKDRDIGWKIFGGYQFNPYLALEAAYVDLGTFTTTAGLTPTFIGGVPADAKDSFHPYGFNADIVGILPLGSGFGLLARIGVFRWTPEAKSTTSIVLVGLNTSASAKPTGTHSDFGIGAKYDFGKSLGARIEFQRFKSIGDGDTGQSDVDLISASILYRFD